MVEPLSLDEAYLDVTQNKKGNQVPAFWQKKFDCVF
jgi:nucleotidyltransferase/DNA polymerase involved in DNA repair